MSTTKTSNNESVSKNIRFKRDLLELIEEHKNPLIPFSAFVQQACREKLGIEGAQVDTSKPELITKPVIVESSRGSTQQRKQQTIDFINAEFKKLSEDQIADINNASYPQAKLREFTDIEKHHIDNHRDLVKSKLMDLKNKFD